MALSFVDDLRTAYRKDPALHGHRVAEVLTYQGIWAIWSHRLAHYLWQMGVPFVPRLISQLARFLTGIEIHPGARVGRRCFIDHGAGVVIGETAEIGDDVMFYHGVTLGAHGWWVDAKGAKRHPTIGNNVTLALGCSVLGPISIGDNCRIGPHAVVVHDIPADSIVVGALGRCIVRGGVKVATPGEEELLPPGWLQDYEMGAL